MLEERKYFVSLKKIKIQNLSVGKYLFLECNYKCHCTFFLTSMLILKSSVKINCFHESREAI